MVWHKDLKRRASFVTKICKMCHKFLTQTTCHVSQFSVTLFYVIKNSTSCLIAEEINGNLGKHSEHKRYTNVVATTTTVSALLEMMVLYIAFYGTLTKGHRLPPSETVVLHLQVKDV